MRLRGALLLSLVLLVGCAPQEPESPPVRAAAFYLLAFQVRSLPPVARQAQQGEWSSLQRWLDRVYGLSEQLARARESSPSCQAAARAGARRLEQLDRQQGAGTVALRAELTVRKVLELCS